MDLAQVLTIGIALVGSLGGAYLGVRVALTDLKGRVTYLEREVGISSDEGLRGDRHRLANAIQDHETRIHALERK
jgi:hypothetical protein